MSGVEEREKVWKEEAVTSLSFYQYSYNRSQQDALFLKFILVNNVSDRFIVRHQES